MRSKIDKTDVRLAEMLKENTGESIFDSGDYYGRQFERNAERDFVAEPAAKLDIRDFRGKTEVDVTLSLFRFLRDRVAWEEDVQKKFDKFAEYSDPDWSWTDTLEAFLECQACSGDSRIVEDGEYGSGYTYNMDNMLDQDFQWQEFELDGSRYCMIQSHNGCDARGGLSGPMIVSWNDGNPCDCGRASITPEEQPDEQPDDETQAKLFDVAPYKVDIHWDTEDGGYRWVAESKRYKSLSDYPVSSNPEDRGKGKIYVDEQKIAHCPLTGTKLHACCW